MNAVLPIRRDLTRRNRQDELMDRPDLDADAFIGSLRGLRRINAITFATRLLWPYLESLARQANAPLRVLDVGSGAGDIPIRLAYRAQRANLPMRFIASDLNPLAVDFGCAAARRANVDVDFIQLDALHDPLPDNIDVITSSLFLHHLDRAAATTFLRRAKDAARRAIVVHDLDRNRLGYAFAYVGVRLISRSPIVHTDGPRSVEGAFTVDEASDIADEAGLDGHRIDRKFPFRWVLTWKR